MKKITLLVALMGIGQVSAQFNLDFESALNQNIASNTDQLMAYIIDNPDIDGINTSKSVLKIVEFSGTEYWGSAIIDKFNTTISLHDGRYFSIDFLSPKEEGVITLKLQKGIEKDFFYSGKANTWRRAVFSFSNFPKSTNSTKIDVIFDVRDHKNPKKFSPKNRVEENFWIDNITQSNKRIRKK